MKAQVSISRGDDRYANVMQALQLIAGQIDLSRCQNVLIKPNLVSTVRQLASTHVDAVRAVLDFIRQRYMGKVVIAEAAALAPTMEGYQRFGYAELARRYGVELVDLNAGPVVMVQVYDRKLEPRAVRLARSVIESDFRISVGPPKTHDEVIVTLSLKNMVFGSLINPSLAKSAPDMRKRYQPGPLRVVYETGVLELVKMMLPGPRHSDKMRMHQGTPVINLNLATVAPWVKAHLAVIDGYEGMEGAGPNDGHPVDWKVAIAGTDSVAVDALTTHLMGFEPDQIGYLTYCQQMGLGVGDLSEIEVFGETPAAVRRFFRPHPRFEQQRAWHFPGVERWLRQAPEVSA